MDRYTIEISENIASKYRIEWNLSLNEAISLHSLILKLNIITIFRPLSETSYGISIKTLSGLKFMLINSSNTIGRQNFTIAHELFHLYVEKNPIPHICSLNKGKNNSEKNADLFASSFLMPKTAIFSFLSDEEINKKTIFTSTIIKMEQYFNVSHSALIIRLKQLKLLSESQYNDLMFSTQVKEVSKSLGYKTTLYEKGNEGLVIGDYIEKANQLLEQDMISEGHHLSLINTIFYGEN